MENHTSARVGDTFHSGRYHGNSHAKNIDDGMVCSGNKRETHRRSPKIKIPKRQKKHKAAIVARIDETYFQIN
jgi:hypothetical protein